MAKIISWTGQNQYEWDQNITVKRLRTEKNIYIFKNKQTNKHLYIFMGILQKQNKI